MASSTSSPIAIAKPAQRHRVDGDAEVAHHEDRCQQRKRNRCQADEGRAEVPQEQKQHDRHHHAAFDQRALTLPMARLMKSAC